MLHIVAAIAGVALLLAVLGDAFYTVVMARRVQRPFLITRAFYTFTWSLFSKIARLLKNGATREHLLGIYGPLSLLVLLACWAGLLILAFGVLQWAAGLDTGRGVAPFSGDLYFSGSSLFSALTAPALNATSKVLTLIEAGLGLTLLALVISYLPVLYQSFSNRETRIALMDTRAGSPPSASELIRRQGPNPDKLEQQLADWETWTSEVLESHLSYPMLAYLRCHHSNQSWLATLVTVVDASALVMLTGSGDLQRQAQRAFALGRHSLVDISIAFHIPPQGPARERLSAADLDRLRSGLAAPLHPDALSGPKLDELRAMYEPYANSLSEYFLTALPAWIPAKPLPDNWQLTAYGRTSPPSTVSDPFQKSAIPKV